MNGGSRHRSPARRTTTRTRAAVGEQRSESGASEGEQFLEGAAVGQVVDHHRAAGADVVEGGADVLEGRACELRPRQPVEGELEGVGGLVAAGLPVDDEEPSAGLRRLGVDRVDAAADDLTGQDEREREAANTSRGNIPMAPNPIANANSVSNANIKPPGPKYDGPQVEPLPRKK